METPGRDSAIRPLILNKSHLPNSCLQVVSHDVTIGCIFLSILLAGWLFSSIFASFYLLVYSDVLNLSSLDMLVYILSHLFLFWLSNNNA